MKLINIDNVRYKLSNGFGIKKTRLYNPNDKWRKYKLLEKINVQLSNGRIIIIEEGFEWDLSSVPKFLWGILPPDGDWELAALIHDYLYRNNLGTRSEADKEMLKWSMILNHTESRISFRRLDNNARYIGVRLFGYFAWKK